MVLASWELRLEKAALFVLSRKSCSDQRVHLAGGGACCSRDKWKPADGDP